VSPTIANVTCYSASKMAKSSKLVAVKRGRILLVRRRRDRLWMFPGGQKRGRESAKDCLRRVSGNLTIGDKHEIDKASWSKPRGTRLTPTSRYIRDKLFPKR
jgi:8-oxo-dGTP diphosphatase